MKYKHQIIVKKFRLKGRFKFRANIVFDFEYYGSYCRSTFDYSGDFIGVWRLGSRGWDLRYRSNYKKLSTATLIMAVVDWIEANEI